MKNDTPNNLGIWCQWELSVCFYFAASRFSGVAGKKLDSILEVHYGHIY
jgi:hypothetical protein